MNFNQYFSKTKHLKNVVGSDLLSFIGFKCFYHFSNLLTYSFERQKERLVTIVGTKYRQYNCFWALYLLLAVFASYISLYSKVPWNFYLYFIFYLMVEKFWNWINFIIAESHFIPFALITAVKVWITLFLKSPNDF